MTAFGMGPGLPRVGVTHAGPIDSIAAVRPGEGGARPGGTSGSAGGAVPADRADLAVPVPPDAAARYAAAQMVNRADRTLEQIGGMLADLREQLGFVKLYPPYPPDEPRRAALIRQLLNFHGYLEAVAGTLADQRAKFAAGARAALGIDAADGADVDKAITAAAIGRELAGSSSGLTRPAASGYLHALG